MIPGAYVANTSNPVLPDYHAEYLGLIVDFAVTRYDFMGNFHVGKLIVKPHGMTYSYGVIFCVFSSGIFNNLFRAAPGKNGYQKRKSD